MKKHLMIFGHGYSAAALSRRLLAKGWRVTGTTRNPDRMDAIANTDVEPVLWPGADIEASLATASHLLISAGPDLDGDPVLRALKAQIVSGSFEWVGYLSTTGVYGDHDGGWVDETTPLTPSTKRGQFRVQAERAWMDAATQAEWPLQIFRLAGIYGPGRGPFAKVRKGTARRIIKPGQVFSRIHVEDIAQVLEASITRPRADAVYNVCDDEAAPPQDVIAHAATLLGMPIPPAVDIEATEMSEMARSFYAESKRVSNDLIKNELGVRLRYPDYRIGLKALLDQTP